MPQSKEEEEIKAEPCPKPEVKAEPCPKPQKQDSPSEVEPESPPKMDNRQLSTYTKTREDFLATHGPRRQVDFGTQAEHAGRAKNATNIFCGNVYNSKRKDDLWVHILCTTHVQHPLPLYSLQFMHPSHLTIRSSFLYVSLHGGTIAATKKKKHPVSHPSTSLVVVDDLG